LDNHYHHSFGTGLRESPALCFLNPVKHGLAENAKDYPFSNYKEFLSNWQMDFSFTDMDEVSDVPEF